MTWDREMQLALEEDGRRLLEMTGQDHGPIFLVDCPTCKGAGATYDGPCYDCMGTGQEVSDTDPDPLTLADLQARCGDNS